MYAIIWLDCQNMIVKIFISQIFWIGAEIVFCERNNSMSYPLGLHQSFRVVFLLFARDENCDFLDRSSD